MNILSGEIGKLSFNGEQVGGFKYWTAMYNKTTGETKVKASKFWKLKDCPNELEAEFYADTGDTLKLVRKLNVKVTFPECKLNAMITSPLEINLGVYDWLKS
jgi:hypothetical protein